MTLKEERENKEITITSYVTPDEADLIANTYKKLRERLTMDIDDKPMRINGKSNEKRIAGAQVGGVTDPVAYLKLDNYFKQMEVAFRSRTPVTETDMPPTELSTRYGDVAAARRLTRAMNGHIRMLDANVMKRRGLGTTQVGSVTGKSRFEVVSAINLTAREDLPGGAKIKDLIKKGIVVPELGETIVPPVERKLWRGDKLMGINTGILVFVKDNAELTTEAMNPSDLIKIDGGRWKKFVNLKPGFKAPGVTETSVNYYRAGGNKVRPKNIEELVQMSVALAVAHEYGIIAPRPIIRPTSTVRKDPDDPKNAEKNYYQFFVGGFGPGGVTRRAAEEEVFESRIAIPEID